MNIFHCPNSYQVAEPGLDPGVSGQDLGKMLFIFPRLVSQGPMPTPNLAAVWKGDKAAVIMVPSA